MFTFLCTRRKKREKVKKWKREKLEFVSNGKEIERVPKKYIIP